MNAAEVLQLCRLVKACCPSQTIDQYTPDAWLAILGRYDYRDAQQAVYDLASAPLEPGRSRYIEPGHIIGGVQRIRGKRLDLTPLPAPPAGLDSADYLAWSVQAREAIASGRYAPTETAPAIPAPEGLADLVRAAQPRALAAATAPDGPRVTEEQIEAERTRQLAALAALAEGDPA